MKMTKIVVTFTLLALSCAAISRAADQKTFDTAHEAVKALVAAMATGNEADLLAVFGPDAKDLISSGDDVQDKNSRERFLKSYNIKHSIVTQDANRKVLVIGPKDWEMPIPLVLENGKWRFDTAAGQRELIYRRIGNNELGAIAACRGFIAAQAEYASKGHDGLPAGMYTAKLRSEPGKQDGLYWEPKEGEPESPAGPYLAKSSAEGYQKGDPYHGYYYHTLTAQGAAAKGGAKSYIVDGQLKGGVALVAYPAQYKSSGVMTFIVNQDGVVYQKDLGENTEEAAKAITEYNPDSTWKKVTD